MSNYYNDQWRLPNNENKDKQSNYSMDFDAGSSQYIDTNFVPADNLTANCSISAWVNMPAINNNTNSSILGTYDFTDNSPIGGQNRARFFLRIYRTNNVYYYMIGLGTVQDITVAISNFSVNTWVHLAVTYDGTYIKLYSNGTLDGTINAGSVGSYPPIGAGFDGISYIGATHRSSGANAEAYITGKIDAVSIFDYALTDGTGGTVNQIAALYGSSSTGIGNPMSLSPAPIAYYPLGDQDAFNGADYLVPNSSLKDYVFDFIGAGTSSSGPHINLGNDSSLSPSSEITVSIWIKTDSNSPLTASGYLDKYSGGGYLLDFGGSSGTNKAGVKFGSSGTRITSTTIVADQKWHNILFTCDNTTLRFYVDGNEEVTSSATIADLTSTKNLKIGGDGSSVYFFDGKLSNFQIFNTALPATGSNSVETLYNNGSPLTSMSGFTSLQGWWKLDASATYDGTDWTIPDDSTNSNDGTSSGMTQANLVQSDLSFTSGYSPYALDFDGANDLVDLGRPSSLNLMPSVDEFSISAWFKTSAQGTIYSFGAPSSNSNTQIKIAIRGGDYLPEVVLKGTATTIGSTTYNDGNWHNIILTCTTSTANLYIDGSNVGSPTIGTATITSTDNGAIGARTAPTGGFFFNGSLSNLSIWNTALTSAQVTEVYNEGVPSNLNNHSAYSNLISWWQLGSNTSWVDPYWIALDEKGTNNGESQNVAAPNNMGENAIVDGVGSYANGLSSGMVGDEVIGDAPYSTANSLSVNMDVEDRTDDTPS